MKEWTSTVGYAMACAFVLSFLPVKGAEATKVELLLEADQVRPGTTLWAGLRFELKDGWHIYWRNGGDAGQPASIVWDLPEGVEAGEIRWPPPEKYLSLGLYSYVYHGEVVLLVPLTVNAEPGDYSIGAQVDWLECEELCVPGSAAVTAALRVGSEDRPSAAAEQLGDWLARVPAVDPSLAFTASWLGDASGEARRLRIALAGEAAETLTDFYPHAYQTFKVGDATETDQDGGLLKEVSLDEGDWPEEIVGLAMLGRQNEAPRLVKATLNLAGSAASEAGPPTESFSFGTFVLMLGFAFLGGFILNFMPCVLPVIALKIFGFINQKESVSVRRQGVLYGLGVLVSFLILAGVVIAVKQTERVPGWGMQFQNVQFLVLMTILVLLVSLNFFGVFEITLGSKTMGALGQLSGQKGEAGAFFNGILATALATPCTAPFLSVALGFAFSQPSALILLFFVTIAMGLAFPYVAISWNPRLLKWLPKPGPWMARFKTAMGFPMIATAVWLYSVTLNHFDSSAVLWLGMLLVSIAIAVWIWGQFVQQSGSRRPLAMALALAVGFGSGFWILEGKLSWRAPVRAQGAGGIVVDQGIEWLPWSREAVAETTAQGKAALIDFTADWCLICLANKRSITIDSVKRKLEDTATVAYRADYTVYDPEIADELKRYDRAGVPMVLVFPPQADSEPEVLPTVLTPQIVLDALERAHGE